MPTPDALTVPLSSRLAVMPERAPLAWGMAFLLLFTVVVVSRVQEVIPAIGSLRPGLVTGAAAIFCWLVAPGSLEEKIPWTIKQVRYMLVLFGLSVITIPVGVWPGHSFEFVTGPYWKVVVLFLLVLYWCRSVKDVHRMIWVYSLSSIMLVGLSLLTGEMGDERFHAESKSYDPNDLALLMVMVLPLLLYLFTTTKLLPRILISAMIVTALYSIVLTQSRGGLLALLAVGGLILLRGPLSRANKTLLIGLSLLVFIWLAGGSYWERMETMWSPQTEYDRSAGGRLEVWKTGVILMATHPWGVGIDGFTTAEGLAHGGEGKWSAAHNTFLQVGVELGVAGLIVFLLWLLHTIKDLRRIQARSTKLPVQVGRIGVEERSPGTVVPLAAALEISLWGFIVGGFFLSAAYSGLLYILLALSLVCSRLAGNVEEPSSGGGINERVRGCGDSLE